MTTTLVTIPGASASRSKMQKKGWKCWAKNLTNVNSPARNGYDYDGEFMATGDDVELEIGDVILHVDDSRCSSIGVVVQNRVGRGIIIWVADADDKWAGPLAKPARHLLGLTREERVRHAAQHYLDRPRDTPMRDEVRDYWLSVAAPETGQSKDRSAAITTIRDLMQQHGITAADLS